MLYLIYWLCFIRFIVIYVTILLSFNVPDIWVLIDPFMSIKLLLLLFIILIIIVAIRHSSWHHHVCGGEGSGSPTPGVQPSYPHPILSSLPRPLFPSIFFGYPRPKCRILPSYPRPSDPRPFFVKAPPPPPCFVYHALKQKCYVDGFFVTGCTVGLMCDRHMGGPMHKNIPTNIKLFTILQSSICSIP